MTAFSPSSLPIHSAPAQRHRATLLPRRSSLREKVRAVALLTLVNALWNWPVSWAQGQVGINLLLEMFFAHILLAGLLVGLMTAVERFAGPGAMRTLAFAGGAILASAVTCIVETITFKTVGVWRSQSSSFVTIVINMGPQMVMSLCFVLIYDYRVRVRYRTQVLRDMRLRRAHVVRETVQSQLQAMQARVDPGFLFDTMACVERTYARDPARGDRLLDDLIAYLRAMLPDLRSSTSTLDRELALGRAYADIRSMILDRDVRLDVDVTVGAEAIAFPPMCLVPMLQFLLADAGGIGPVALALRVRVHDSMVRVDAHGTGASMNASLPETEALEAMRRRLHDLYGERMRLSIENDAATGCRVLLEIPHEHSDGPDRRG